MNQGRNQVTNEVRNASETLPHSTPLRKEQDLGSSTQVRRGRPGLRAIRSEDVLAATVVTLTALRPDWRADVLDEVLAADPRPWRTVITAALVVALDGQGHPALIPTTAPARFAADAGPTPTPPTVAEWRAAHRCAHGEIDRQCALCRRNIPAEETA
jgi:hypothetical protein